MKKIATLLISIVILLFNNTAVQAQDQCPGTEVTSKTSFAELASSTPSQISSEQVLAIMESDLSAEAQTICLATNGRWSRLPARLQADDELSSVLDETWVINEWINEFLFNLFYDQLGRLTGGESFFWDEEINDWVKETLTTASLDENGEFAQILFSEWNGSAYVEVIRQTFSRDEFGNTIESVFEEKDGEDWVIVIRTTSTTEGGLIKQTTTEVRDEETGLLTNSQRSTFEYDGENREIVDVVEAFNAEMSTWEIIARNLTDFQESSIVETTEFSVGPDTWLVFSETISNLDENGLVIEEIRSQAITGPLSPSGRTLYVYNNMQLQIEGLDQTSDGAGGWNDSDLNTTTYDGDGDIMVDLYQVFEAAAASKPSQSTAPMMSAVWVNDDRSTYIYGEVATSIEDASILAGATFSIYPNPARGQLQLDVTLAGLAALEVEVFNLLGQRVAVLANATAATGQQRIKWMPDNLPAGMYLVRLKVNEEVETRPVIVLQ